MVVLKFIAIAIAIFMSCLYVNSLVVDISDSFICAAFKLHTEDAEKKSKMMAKTRIVLSLIMALAWSTVAIL